MQIERDQAGAGSPVLQSPAPFLRDAGFSICKADHGALPHNSPNAAAEKGDRTAHRVRDIASAIEPVVPTTLPGDGAALQPSRTQPTWFRPVCVSACNFDPLSGVIGVQNW